MILKDVLDFVAARTDLVSRDDLLREVNNAWFEIWNSEDLPNSVFEISLKPVDNTARITLPYFIDVVRGVKANIGRPRVDLNTPRPYYQDESYYQSPYTWRILGQSPLTNSILNATQLRVSIPYKATKQFKVTISGPYDTATNVREQLTFSIGTQEVWTTRRFIDATSIVKDTLLDFNVSISGANGEDYGIIPNLFYEARNTVVQITDKCLQCCTNCRCYDVLYKTPAPVLYYDEQSIPFPQVLMNKTLEYIAMPKDGQEKRTAMYAAKADALSQNYNNNDRSVEKHMDLGRNLFCSYTGGSTSSGKL